MRRISGNSRASTRAAAVIAWAAAFWGPSPIVGEEPAAPDAAASAPADGNSPAAETTPPKPEDVAYFEEQVRPLLVKRCYKCHSHESETLRGNLYLDSRAGWAKGGDSGPSIVPGNADESLLVQAVRYDEGGFEMPPDGKLPEEEISVFVEWVRRGAPDPRGEMTTAAAKPARVVDIEAERKHWSFQPLAAVEPPVVSNAAWPRGAIDQFILAGLESQSLTPSAEADRRVLVRRLYFDLVGLPPEPEVVEQFVADSDPQAYEKLVDRLLASPHFGERWARHWLDLARYAESHGFEHDTDRPTAYHFRDFVIRALNDDLPYDKFVAWQLAGDELEPGNPLALMATGFLAAGVHSTQITKNQVEKERYDELDDIVATMGTSMLGLTIGCARCHDHKYDPIPTRDYYRLVASFTTAVRTEMDLDLEPAKTRELRESFDREHAPLAAELARYERDELPARFDAWLAARRAAAESVAAGGSGSGPPGEASTAAPAAVNSWLILEPVEQRTLAGPAGGSTLRRLADDSLLAENANPDNDEYTIVIQTRQQQLTALRIEALAHESFPKGGPGRAENGNFALSAVEVSAAPLTPTADGSPAEPKAIKLEKRLVTFEQEGLPAAAAVDGDAKSAWAVDPQIGRDHALVLSFDRSVGFAEGTRLTVTLRFGNNKGHNIGRVRLAATTAPVELATLEMPARPQSEQEVETLLAARPEAPAELRPDLLRWFARLDEGWRARALAASDHALHAPRPKLTKVLATSEGLPALRLHTQGGDFLDHTHFLMRGDPNQKLEIAEQGFLQVLMNSPEAEQHWRRQPPDGWRTSYRRKSLAGWITDTECGAGQLLARVAVNRLWQHHFGRGLVATPSDFGTQGERPTHPELLDWLAAELIRNEWRLKAIHRLIVTSAAYRQGSAFDSDKAAVDTANRLWWRREPTRLEGEVVRDSLLALSGAWNREMYGPGSLDAGNPRRSVYLTVKRSKLVPMMVLFDGPDALQGLGNRSQTTVAPQALLLVNSGMVRGWASGFATKLLERESSGDAAALVDAAYRHALARPPAPDELADAVAFLAAQQASHESAGHANPRHGACTDLCQVLFGLNEFIYID